jgi:hypothetical protein
MPTGAPHCQGDGGQLDNGAFTNTGEVVLRPNRGSAADTVPLRHGQHP